MQAVASRPFVEPHRCQQMRLKVRPMLRALYYLLAPCHRFNLRMFFLWKCLIRKSLRSHQRCIARVISWRAGTHSTACLQWLIIAHKKSLDQWVKALIRFKFFSRTGLRLADVLSLHDGRFASSSYDNTQRQQSHARQDHGAWFWICGERQTCS